MAVGKEWKVIAVNLAGSSVAGTRAFRRCGRWAAKEYVFYDEFNDVRYIRTAEELSSIGLFVRREGFDAHLFNVSPA